MHTFLLVLVVWIAISFIYAMFIADKIPDGKLGFILDLIIAAPAMIFLVAGIAIYDVIENIREKNRRK